jgi:hypothetical protein
MLMVMFMKVSGIKIKLQEKESIHIWMEPNMMVNGLMINKMDKEVKNGLMELIMKEFTFKVKNMD